MSIKENPISSALERMKQKPGSYVLLAATVSDGSETGAKKLLSQLGNGECYVLDVQAAAYQFRGAEGAARIKEGMARASASNAPVLLTGFHELQGEPMAEAVKGLSALSSAGRVVVAVAKGSVAGRDIGPAIVVPWVPELPTRMDISGAVGGDITSALRDRRAANEPQPKPPTPSGPKAS